MLLLLCEDSETEEINLRLQHPCGQIELSYTFHSALREEFDQKYVHQAKGIHEQ